MVPRSYLCVAAECPWNTAMDRTPGRQEKMAIPPGHLEHGEPGDV
jgi:hypothetical protein